MIGLPDFQDAHTAGAPAVLPAFGVAGAHTVLPDALELARRPDGTPDLSLELLKGTDAMRGSAPHGVLELGLRAATDLAAALERVRAADPAATVAGAAFRDGWLTLVALGVDAAAQPRAEPVALGGEAALAEPVALGSGGLEATRWVLRLQADGAALVKRCLLEGVVTIVARAQLYVAGVAPRLALKVRYDPAAVRDALLALAAGAPALDREELLAALRERLDAVPFELLGDVDEIAREALVLTLADLVARDLATAEPGHGERGGAQLAPLAAERLPAGPVEIDLRKPATCRRPLVLALDPLASARSLLGEHAGNAIRETALPTLRTGAYDVSVVANLPVPRAGVLALTATLTAAPFAPHRPHAVSRTVELLPPADRVQTMLMLSPVEPLAFRCAPQAVVAVAGRPLVLDGPERGCDAAYVRLTVDDFPLRFVPVSASAGLLALARIAGVLRATLDGQPFEQRFQLTAAQPRLSIAMPAGASGALFELRAEPPDGRPAIVLDPRSADPVHLELHSLAGYGPHRVHVAAQFLNGRRRQDLELVAEADGAAAEARIGRLSLTPERPAAEWTWFAPSPFRAGYRYRLRDEAALAQPPWSDVRPPGEPLEIAVGAS